MLRYHGFVFLIDSDVMDGLIIAQERGEHGIEMRDLIFRERKAGAGFCFQDAGTARIGNLPEPG